MKKYLLMILLAFLFILTNEQKLNAQSNGSCIIKQQEKTYTIDTPFYWYEVNQTISINSNMTSNTTYNHIETYINNEETCLKINNSTPSYNEESNSLPTYKITTFYFSTTSLNDSEYIFNSSSSIFNKPNMISNIDYKITSNYISLDNSPPVIVNDNLNTIIITPIEHIINASYLKTKITDKKKLYHLLNIKNLIL